MSLCKYLISIYLIGAFILIHAKEIDATEYEDAELTANSNSNIYLVKDELHEQEIEKVDIKLYYESLCYGSQQFFTLELAPTVRKLGQYLDVKIYPYGHAKTAVYDGKYSFTCQHGHKECYGNKIHACSIDQLGNMTEAVEYIACTMRSSRTYSMDNVADECGRKLNINSDPIKKCAKSDQGDKLLKYYGDESKKANLEYVPLIFINDIIYEGIRFMRDVCAAFNVPPPPCRH